MDQTRKGKRQRKTETRRKGETVFFYDDAGKLVGTSTIVREGVNGGPVREKLTGNFRVRKLTKGASCNE